MRIAIWLIGIYCCWNTLLFGQFAEAPPIRHFSPDVYRAGNQNWAIGQTADRQIWVANSGGLLSFQGTDWAILALPHNQPVRSLAVCAENRLFVGGFAEFGYWERTASSGKLRYRSLSRNLVEDDEEFWHILQVDSTVYFQSFAQLYAYQGDSVRQIPTPGNILFARPGLGGLLIPVINHGLYTYRPEQGFKLLPGTESVGNAEVRGILRTQDGGLLIATERSGLLLWKDGRLRAWDFPAASEIRQHTINQIHRLRNGDLAVGTILGGLYLLSPTGELRLHLNQANGLNDNTILSIFEDADGNVWLGLDRGIDLLVLSHPLRFGGRELGSVYAAVLADGYLYVGTNRGLFRRSYTSGTSSFELVEGSQGQVWSLYEANGVVLCGHNLGTYTVEGDTLRPISEETGGGAILPIPGRPNYLLQATYTGIVRLAFSEERGWQFDHRYSEIFAPIRQLEWSPDGHLIAIHENRGLYSARLSQDLASLGEVTRLDTLQPLSSPFALSVARCDSHLLLQTPRQSYLLDGAKLTAVDRWLDRSLLSGSRLTCLDNGDLIQHRVDQIVYQGAVERAFSVRPASSFPRFFLLTDDTVLFGLDQGYALLQPSNLDASSPVPSARITRLDVIDRAGTLDTTIFDDGGLRLQATQNRLHFWFTESNFEYPPQFSYQLVGFDERWSAPSTRNYVRFQGLPPGTYRLELRAPDGGIADSFQFVLAPPWYQSTWATLLYGCLGLILFYLLHRFHRHRLQRQRRQLEQEQARQLQEERIQLRNEQLQAANLRKSKELANTTFSLVRKNEILQELKQELVQVNGEEASRLRNLIDKHLRSSEEETVFDEHFTEVHEDFFRRLKRTFPNLSPGDLRLAAYLKMNLSSKEIAPLLRISLRGVENKRYRLRKKMNLPADEPLQDFLLKF